MFPFSVHCNILYTVNDSCTGILFRVQYGGGGFSRQHKTVGKSNMLNS
jgi:hypothetical protein